MADRIRIEIGGGGNPRIGLGVPESPRVSVRGPYVGAPIPEFDGPYDMTPEWHEQTLATQGRKMADDVTFHEITKQETPNEYGGLTLSI